MKQDAGGSSTQPRTGQAPPPAGRHEFHLRFIQRFVDPAFDSQHDVIAGLEEIAFEAYTEGRKSPHSRPAGRGYADPGHELSDAYPKHLAGRAMAWSSTAMSPVSRASAAPCPIGSTGWAWSTPASPAVWTATSAISKPYFGSHEALDRDDDVQQETVNAARAVLKAVSALRRGELQPVDAGLTSPRQK